MGSIQTKIIQIGNSQGVRIPKAFMEQCGLNANDGLISMRIENNTIIIEPVSENRTGWSEAFKQMNAVGDDRLIYEENISTDWDSESWEW